MAQVAKFATPYPPPKPLDYKETGGADRSLQVKTFCAGIARFPALDESRIFDIRSQGA